MPMPEKKSVVADREARQDGHEERRAEHRDDVLDADGDRESRQLRRSSGFTTWPGSTVRPLPCSFQVGMALLRIAGGFAATISGSSL